MTCNKCGHNIPADAKFCPICGARIELKKTNGPQIVLIAALVLLVCACVTLIVAVAGGDSKQETAAQAGTATEMPPEFNHTQAPIIVGGIQTPDVTSGPEQQPQAPVTAEPSDSPDSTPAATDSPQDEEEEGYYYFTSDPELEDKIQSIRDRFYYTQSIITSCELVYYGTSAEGYYDGYGELVMLCEYADSYDGFTYGDLSYSRRYFYLDSGDVYFIYTCSDLTGDEYRMYYDNGKLLRWIDPDGVIYDSPDACAYSDYSWQYIEDFYDYAMSKTDGLLR